MVAPAYIATADQAAYGVSDAAAILRASRLLDAYLGRPEGLVWSPDSVGAPCFMAAAVPSQSWRISGAIIAGSNVPVRLAWAPQKSIIGQVLTFEPGVDGKTEAVTVTDVSGSTITLQTIINGHADQVPLSSGLVINETFRPMGIVPKGFLSRKPVARILGVGYRFVGGPGGLSPGLGSSLAQRSGLFEDGMGAVPQMLSSGSGALTLLDPSSINYDEATGEITPGIGLYTEVRTQYVAGYADGQLPAFVSLACAQLANAMTDDVGPYKSYAAGDTKVEKFLNSVVSSDVVMLLAPLRIGPRL